MNERRKPPKNTGENVRRTSADASRGAKITVELVAFAVLAVYLAGYTLSMLNKPKIGVETVAYGQIDVPKEYQGVVLRNEAATYAAEPGTVYYSYGENEYVKKGSIVCVIKDSDAVTGYEKEIAAINDSLLDRQAMDGSAYSEEINRLNAKMRTEISRAIPLFMAGDSSEVYKFKSALQSDIDTRNEMLLSDSGESLSVLFDRRYAFEMKLDDATSSYTASQGGIISYGVDGLESAFSPKNIMNITQEQIETPSSLLSMGERQVQAGSPLFKIVNSNTWYLCTYLENETALDWEAGASKPIYFKDDGGIFKIPMKITMVEPRGDKTYVALSSSKYLPDFMDARHVTFSLEEDTFKGLKVPNTALTEKTALMLPSDYIYEQYGANGVYVKDGGGLAFKRVNVLSSSGGEAWILQNFDSVKLGDTVYKTQDKRAVEGEGFVIDKIKTAPGLYVANSGTAEFRQVAVLKNNEYYSIIEKGPGVGVKSYDTIITDASAVNDNQIIR